MAKLRVGVVFGGHSGEHEVSVASARSVMEAIDRDRYEVVPIAITRAGQWLPGVTPQELATPGDAPTSSPLATAPGATGFALLPQASGSQGAIAQLDVIFPVLHGTYGEDGSLQGMLEMAGLPYVGSGVLGSALAMDKEKTKVLFYAKEMPVIFWMAVTRREVEEDLEALVADIEEGYDYPIFVKPANLGSSVGISKAHDGAELHAALTLAARYDRKLIVEPGKVIRELEVAVLGNDDPQASVVGEIVPSGEFYDYRAKYLDGASQILIPAPIPDALAQEIRQLAIRAFQELELSGLARVDFFLDRQSGRVYLNEVNTLPGFTAISMYPKLWEATGLPYPQLIDRLIALALERHADRQRNATALHEV